MMKIDQKLTEAAGDYSEAKRIARNGDTSARCALASQPDTKPEILYYLAEDPNIEVRRLIAENAETPRHADILLAQDECDEVRQVLATKIGRLFPETSATERSVLRRAVLDVLEVLAADHAKHVRELVSETLKNAPDVPPHIVRMLANDPHLTVCGPVLEFSPVLTEADLLEIISSKPVQGAFGAISRRSALGELVSDAIAATSDKDAIRDLLANPSAQIREETLDGLIDNAPAFESWHAPLVERPTLPARAAHRIARFVTQSLLDQLRQRTDLENEVLDAVETAVNERLSNEAAHAPPQNRWVQGSETKPLDDPSFEFDPERRVEDLHAQGKLNERVIGDAAAAGDRGFTVAALAKCAGENRESVSRVFEMQSTKGIVALCWKAKMSMELAIRLQITIGNIAPGSILKSDSNPDYPLSEDEMSWQLKFFRTTI